MTKRTVADTGLTIDQMREKGTLLNRDETFSPADWDIYTLQSAYASWAYDNLLNELEKAWQEIDTLRKELTSRRHQYMHAIDYLIYLRNVAQRAEKFKNDYTTIIMHSDDIQEISEILDKEIENDTKYG